MIRANDIGEKKIEVSPLYDYDIDETYRNRW